MLSKSSTKYLSGNLFTFVIDPKLLLTLFGPSQEITTLTINELMLSQCDHVTELLMLSNFHKYRGICRSCLDNLHSKLLSHHRKYNATEQRNKLKPSPQLNLVM